MTSMSSMASGPVVLCLTAVFVGIVHTAAGPDHSIPFVAMARAGGWSPVKTFWVTTACGFGHVAGSALLGIVGLTVGGMVFGAEAIDALRGDVASWMLIGFGAALLARGLLRAARGHLHAHEPPADAATPWMLFLIFVFGPSEPLVPLLMVPASRSGPAAVAGVVAAFAVATVVTMLGSVFAIRYGATFVPGPRLGRFEQAAAGLALLACGVLVQWGL
jgi:nickel/cobalt transporter (NicO) family protein